MRRILVFIAVLILALGGLGVAGKTSGIAMPWDCAAPYAQNCAEGVTICASVADLVSPCTGPLSCGWCQYRWAKPSDALPGMGLAPDSGQPQNGGEPAPWPVTLADWDWTVRDSTRVTPGNAFPGFLAMGPLDPLTKDCVLRI